MPENAKERKSHIWNRDELDWYVEPGSSTTQLLAVEKFNGAVWDPCCGGGNVVRALLAEGYQAIGTDIVERPGQDPEWFRGTVDFLYSEQIPVSFAPNIVFNPPFFKAKGAELAIRRALAVSKGKVAAFVTEKFLTGSKRARGLYTEFPPSRVWHITPRPSCPPGDFILAGGDVEGDTKDYCWIVWDRTSPAVGPYAGGWLK